VVYEVTPEDYRTIIATEGGGASYQDVLVDCYPLAVGLKTAPSERGEKSVVAHTLLCPPNARFSRPDPTYAQPSARYLKLLTDGAEEHALPDDYIAYLYSLQPYTITTSRQTIGKVSFIALWGPFMLIIFGLSRMMADGEGRIPTWLAKISAAIINLAWVSYDVGFKKLFGDGERTMEQEEERVWGEKTVGIKM